MTSEKAKRLYADFKEFDEERTDEGFQALAGWFDKFEIRQLLYNTKIVGEAAPAAA